MTVDQWCEMVRLIAEDANANGSDSFHQRSLIFGLWRAFMGATIDIQNEFELIGSDELNLQGFKFGSDLGSRIPLKIPAATPLSQMVRFAAFLLRGLEKAFIGFGGAAQHIRSQEELLVEYGGVRGFLIPYKPRYREIKTWPSYFQRRGLTDCRCIAEELPTGHLVDLYFSDLIANPDDLVCVAQLFKHCVPLDANGGRIDFAAGGDFVFHGLDESSPPNISERMTEIALSKTPVDVVVFPELTMCEQRRDSLQQFLKRQTWDDSMGGKRAAFVLGGSWHYKRDDGQYENRAPLFDGCGNILGWHVKTIPFRTSKLNEKIVPSNKILVVATPFITVAAAICLDFCDTGRPKSPYDFLDVDLVLVASMGSETTVGAHAAKAAQYWSARKTATFISQQSDNGEFGYVASEPSPNGQFSRRVRKRSETRILR